MPVSTRSQRIQLIKSKSKVDVVCSTKLIQQIQQIQQVQSAQPAWFTIFSFGFCCNLYYNKIKEKCDTLAKTKKLINEYEESYELTSSCKPSTLMNFIKESAKFDEFRDYFTEKFPFARIFPLPSNGNCLFYGVYAYLRMFKNNTPEIQQILGQNKGVFNLRNAGVNKLLSMGTEQSNSGITYVDILDGPTNFKKEVNKLKLNSMWDTEAGDLLPYAIAELTQKKIIILCEHGIEKIIFKNWKKKKANNEIIRLVQYGGHYEIWFPNK